MFFLNAVKLRNLIKVAIISHEMIRISDGYRFERISLKTVSKSFER